MRIYPMRFPITVVYQLQNMSLTWYRAYVLVKWYALIYVQSFIQPRALWWC